MINAKFFLVNGESKYCEKYIKKFKFIYWIKNQKKKKNRNFSYAGNNIYAKFNIKLSKFDTIFFSLIFWHMNTYISTTNTIKHENILYILYLSTIISIFTFIYHHLFQRRGECNDVSQSLLFIHYYIPFDFILLFYCFISFSTIRFRIFLLLHYLYLLHFWAWLAPNLLLFSVFLFYFVQLLHAKIQSDFVLTNKVK